MAVGAAALALTACCTGSQPQPGQTGPYLFSAPRVDNPRPTHQSVGYGTEDGKDMAMTHTRIDHWRRQCYTSGSDAASQRSLQAPANTQSRSVAAPPAPIYTPYVYDYRKDPALRPSTKHPEPLVAYLSPHGASLPPKVPSACPSAPRQGSHVREPAPPIHYFHRTLASTADSLDLHRERLGSSARSSTKTGGTDRQIGTSRTTAERKLTKSRPSRSTHSGGH
ncbi:hypothetical protein NEOLEDRAFT_1172278 [Neolentinus lepideus HHB14362 ss-1]|uniref:Uncharacterized protein n=1 Tax=Neolentinus lepideus HHB14362 ss-1 TaxID=1314782 RepID=A0A165PD58_9AGAM|nr:hypothetical protein NEOLEDRAFT_1172278 [Neolentinus lepideus HHB14362 ss-1]